MASGTEKSSSKRAADKQASTAPAKKKCEKKPLTQSNYQQMVNRRKMQLLNNEVDCSGPIVHEEHILEAIDQMRKRKARPDVDRIGNYMLRHYHVDSVDTINDLARLILIEKVIEVDYKGNTSYRNASKWTKLETYKQATSQGMVKEKINLELVTSVLTELVIDEPDYLDHGVPAARLIEHLLDGVMNPSSKRIVKDFLSKEVANGNVVRLSNGNFSLTSPKQADRNMINSVTSTTTTPQQNGDSENKIKKNSLSLLKGGYTIHFNGDFNEENLKLSTPKSSRQEAEIVLKKKFRNDGSGSQIQEKQLIIAGKELEEISILEKVPSSKREENCRQNGNVSSTNSFSEKDNKNEPQVQQKKSKAERKQRLCVRSDDSSDLLMQFEDFGKEENDKDEDRRDYLNVMSEDEECDHDAGRSSTNPSPTPSNNNTGNFRSARRKRAKKVFDPSDNMVVKKKRGRYANATKISLTQDIVKPVTTTTSPKDPHRHCSLCSKDKQESLIACRDCTVRAHPSCIYLPDEMIQKANTSWQCERCKTCVICYETSEAGPLVTCYNCDDAYHQSCHSPKITTSRVKWFCSECYVKQQVPSSKNSNSHNKSTKNSTSQSNLTKNSTSHSNSSTKKSNTVNNSTKNATNALSNSHNNVSINNNNSIELPSTPTVPSPRVSPSHNQSDNMDDETPAEIDPNIPDASDWTTEQVYQYFARLFPKEAEIFRVQQIDGHSLLLLKRSDVLTGLDLLLGPALKIYRHVLKLQVRRDDPQLYWL